VQSPCVQTSKKPAATVTPMIPFFPSLPSLLSPLPFPFCATSARQRAPEFPPFLDNLQGAVEQFPERDLPPPPLSSRGTGARAGEIIPPFSPPLSSSHRVECGLPADLKNGKSKTAGVDPLPSLPSFSRRVAEKGTRALPSRPVEALGPFFPLPLFLRNTLLARPLRDFRPYARSPPPLPLWRRSNTATRLVPSCAICSMSRFLSLPFETVAYSNRKSPGLTLLPSFPFLPFAGCGS